MINKFKKNKNYIYMLVGLLAVSLIVLPYLVLGTGSYVQIHDQMDGEILNYIYQAKYFLNGNIIPEFMNGMDKSAMLPPAPFGVVFYLCMTPFAAFAAMQWFVLIVGYWGMYKLCRRLGMYLEVCLAVAVIFCYLPFYPTYGLAALGQPMLVLAGIFLLEENQTFTKKCVAFGMIILYAGFSSLTLIGYVWLVAGALLTLWQVLLKRKAQALRIGSGTAVLMFVYVITNLDLFKSLFGSSGFVSHREEMILATTPDLWEKAKNLLFVGGSYSNVYSAGILLSAVLTILTIKWLCVWRKETQPRERILLRTRQMTTIMWLISIGLVWAVLWNSEWFVMFRNAIGGMVTYFQADRVYWVFPFLWVMVLACVLDVWLTCLFETRYRCLKVVLFVASLGLCMVQGAQEFRDGTLNKNIRLMLLPGYQQVTWEAFYMEDVFAEMKTYMEEDTSSYSVVSLGIYPSVALYNGFTCADGYSNNYQLSYKYEFIDIMQEEMGKNEAAEVLVKEWGNRLYLVSGEYGLSPMISKGSGITYENVSYDIDAMKKMNIRYILSAGQIMNASQLGLTLVREEAFSSGNSYYAIWLYEIS